jgi:hypothetical protein
MSSTLTHRIVSRWSAVALAQTSQEGGLKLLQCIAMSSPYYTCKRSRHGIVHGRIAGREKHHLASDSSFESSFITNCSQRAIFNETNSFHIDVQSA